MRVGIQGLKTGELNTYKKELSKAKAVFLTVHDLGSNNWSMRRFASLPAMANIASRYRFTTYFYLLKRGQAYLLCCRSVFFHVVLPGQQVGAADLEKGEDWSR